MQQSRKQVAGKPRQGQAGRAGKGSARNPKPSEDAGSQADSKQLAGPKQKEDAGSKADTKMGDNAKPEEDQGSSAEAEKAEEPKPADVLNMLLAGARLSKAQPAEEKSNDDTKADAGGSRAKSGDSRPAESAKEEPKSVQKLVLKQDSEADTEEVPPAPKAPTRSGTIRDELAARMREKEAEEARQAKEAAKTDSAKTASKDAPKADNAMQADADEDKGENGVFEGPSDRWTDVSDGAGKPDQAKLKSLVSQVKGTERVR